MKLISKNTGKQSQTRRSETTIQSDKSMEELHAFAEKLEAEGRAKVTFSGSLDEMADLPDEEMTPLTQRVLMMHKNGLLK